MVVERTVCCCSVVVASLAFIQSVRVRHIISFLRGLLLLLVCESILSYDANRSSSRW